MGDLDDDLDTIARIVTSRGGRIAVAESATAGAVLAALTAHSGASAFVAGGVVAYDIDAKVAVLGVDRAHAAEVNCVSARVAAEMAAGVRRLFGADIGIATTGYLEPSHAHGVDVPHVVWVVDGSIAGDAIHAEGVHEDATADRLGVRDATVARVVGALAEVLALKR